MPTPNADFIDLMARAGLTPAQVAGLCGVTVRTVRRWRAGASPAPLAAVVVLEVVAQHGLTMAATLNVAALAGEFIEHSHCRFPRLQILVYDRRITHQHRGGHGNGCCLCGVVLDAPRPCEIHQASGQPQGNEFRVQIHVCVFS